jgi:hypothetical protein
MTITLPLLFWVLSGHTATQLVLWGLVVHLVADWLGQNDWMAVNKSNPRHIAGYVHAGIHLLGLLLVFPPLIALALAVSHFVIDLRFPLAWWRGVYKQTTTGPAALHVAMWGDQVTHIALIALAALLVGSGL